MSVAGHPLGLRSARALVLAAVAVTAGVVAHVSAGGEAPVAGTVLGLVGLLAFVNLALTGRTPTVPVAVFLLTVGQLVVHGALTMVVGLGMAMPSMPATPGAMGHMEPATAAAGSLAMLTSGHHLVMMSSHAVAAALAGWWLVAGERAAWALAEVAARRLAGAIGLPLPTPRLLPPWRAVSPPLFLPPWHAQPLRAVGCSVSRRGPPVVAA